MHTTARLAIPLLLSLVLTGCEFDVNSDLKAYVADVKARQKSKIPPLPEAKEFEIFAYNQTELRDPFKPLSSIKDSEGPLVRPNLNRERDPLEEYKIGSLKMMGSLEKDGVRWALIRTSDGTLHRTTKGRYMGDNNGQIVAITENQVQLKEIVPDGLGGWVERYTTLSTDK
jgi:type IV pilus assembly protein PilP